MSSKERKAVKLLLKIVQEGIVLYPILVLIAMFWIISFKWSTGVKLTAIIFLILSIPVLNWLVNAENDSLENQEHKNQLHKTGNTLSPLTQVKNINGAPLVSPVGTIFEELSNESYRNLIKSAEEMLDNLSKLK